MAHRRTGCESSATMRLERVGRTSRVFLAVTVVPLLALGFLHAPGCIAAPVEGIAGWEGDGYKQGYGFAALGARFAEGASVSVPVRITGSYLYYNYRDEGARLSVRAPGAAAMLGLRSTRPWGTFAVFAGGEVRWERRLREAASGSAASVARGGAIVQGEGDIAISRRFHPSLLVNYSGSARYLYGRAALLWQCSNLDWSGPRAWFLGIEGVGQGNADTDAIQAGGSVECNLVRARLSIGIHGGYKDSASSEGSRRQGGYIGGSLYHRF